MLLDSSRADGKVPARESKLRWTLPNSIPLVDFARSELVNVPVANVLASRSEVESIREDTTPLVYLIDVIN